MTSTVSLCSSIYTSSARVNLMFDLPPLMIGTIARSGPSQWLAEMIASFALELTILGGRQNPEFA